MQFIHTLLILGLAAIALATSEEKQKEQSLANQCAEAVDNEQLFEENPGLADACEQQLEIIEAQEELDQQAKHPQEKRKNEFIRFGKRKNEFIRFGRSGASTEGDEAVAKRKNEFIRFGKRKNEFIRFGKRKNEFIRFGKRKNEFIRFGRSGNDHEQQKRKNEFIRFGKRKNEFIRFG